MACRPVTWSSHWQKVVTLLSTQAEYITLTDSTGMESFVKCFVNFTRVRHTCVYEFWLREVIQAGNISILRIPSTENIADMLTKPLGPIIFRKLVGHFGLTKEAK
ncbi:hypothetical protein FKP32DRAFT_1600601 [Trametes sanguinea]|nr:hypothetical protein FKP32DRAFT_1600601 [Trametes sanguinea]